MLGTIDLQNGTILTNNTQPSTCAFYSSVATVPTMGEVLATCQLPGTLLVFNASTGIVSSYASLGLNSSDIAVDDQTGSAFVSNTGSDNVSQFSLLTKRVVGSIAVSGGPYGLAIDPSAGLLFVSSQGTDTLTEVAVNNSTVVRVIPLASGAVPGALAYDSYTQNVYVVESGIDSIQVISARTGFTVAQVYVPGQPTAVTCDPGTGNAFVTVYGYPQPAEIVSLISGATNQILLNGTVGFAPDAVDFVAGTDTLYVANSGTYNVTELNASSLKSFGSIRVGFGPGGLAYDGTTERVYVANNQSNNLAVIDAASESVVGYITQNPAPFRLAAISNGIVVSNQFGGSVEEVNDSSGAPIWSTPLSNYLSGIAVDPSTGHVLVAGADSNEVYDLTAGGTVQARVGVGMGPWAVALDPNDQKAFVANNVQDTVSVINTTSDLITNTVSLRYTGLGGPVDAVYDPTSGTVFVASHGCICLTPGNITFINASTDQTEGGLFYWPGPGPSALAVDYANNTLYVADDYISAVWGFNMTTWNVTAVIPTGASPEGLALNQLNGFLYVANYLANNVTVINTTSNSPIASIPVGVMPIGIAADPSSGKVYVANSGSGTISVIGERSYPVEFTESGLQAGESWNVTLGGSTESGQMSTVTFLEPNGSFSYTVFGPKGYNVTPTSGNVTVDGWGGVGVTVYFEAIPYYYQVTFRALGSPPVGAWSVALGTSTGSATGPDLLLPATNGSYTFVVTPPSGYDVLPQNGTIKVAGSDLVVPLTFTAHPSSTAESTYALTFYEWLVLGLAVASSAAVVVVVTVRRRRRRGKSTE